MASVTRTAVKSLQGGVGYELSGTEEWTPEAVAVTWDGSGASGAFVVAVSFYNDGGALIDRAFPEGVTNAIGDTGRTFFRPFRRGGTASTTTDAVRFNVAGQTGRFLEAYTTAGSIILEDHSGAGFNIASQDPGGTTGGFVSITTADGEVFIGSTNVANRLGVGGDFEVQNNLAATLFRVDNSGAIVLTSPTVLVNLPLADPGVSGQLWNNAGVVTVSP